jgi:hypothetical protein
MSQAEAKTEKNAELKAKSAILQQQQLRLLQDAKTNDDKVPRDRPSPQGASADGV